MLLRGMHDHGCDDIFIIVTDMKRAEMDAATEYFKFVCQYTFGQTVKRKAEREIHYRREKYICCGLKYPFPSAHSLARTTVDRRATQIRARAPAAHALLPTDRPHIPRDPLRAATALHRALLAPNDVLLADTLHAPDFRPRRRHIRRLSLGLPESLLHRRLRDDPLSPQRPRRRRRPPAQARYSPLLPPRAHTRDVQLGRLRRRVLRGEHVAQRQGRRQRERGVCEREGEQPCARRCTAGGPRTGLWKMQVGQVLLGGTPAQGLGGASPALCQSYARRGKRVRL
jgi:hypothetical protein